MDKSIIKELVQESIRAAVGSKQTVELIDLQLTESEVTQINEGLTDFLMAKKLQKVQLKFMERGHESIFFVKNESGIDWIRFQGDKVSDNGKFNGLAEADLFIGERSNEGFKLVTRDSSIKSFIKKIARGLSTVLRLYGGFAIIVGVIALLVAVFVGTALLGSGGGIIAATLGLSSIFQGFVSYGAGWVGMKMAAPQKQMPDSNNIGGTGDDTVVA